MSQDMNDMFYIPNNNLDLIDLFFCQEKNVLIIGVNLYNSQQNRSIQEKTRPRMDAIFRHSLKIKTSHNRPPAN